VRTGARVSFQNELRDHILAQECRPVLERATDAAVTAAVKQRLRTGM